MHSAPLPLRHPDWQPSPSHDAKVIALLKARQAQIEKLVAAHLHHVDVLTGAHLHLTQNIRRIEQRASQKTCRCFDPCKATAVQPWQGSPIAPTNEVKPMNIREKYLKGKYITVDDLRDGPRQEIIIDVLEGKYERPDLLFESGDKLGCNKTNLRTLEKHLGSETNGWARAEVELYVGKLEFNNEKKDSVLIRMKDDEIPFE